MSADDRSSSTGPQDNVPQEQVQTNATWDTGGEKTPGEAKQDRYWDQVDDDNRDAGADTPTIGNSRTGEESVVGARDRNPTSYGAMEDGRPASGATTDPDRKVDSESGS